MSRDKARIEHIVLYLFVCLGRGNSHSSSTINTSYQEAESTLR